MSGWFLMDTTTGGWIEGPLPEAGSARAGGEWRAVPDGWPDTQAWSPQQRAFVSTSPPMGQCAALVALLRSKGVITAAEAEGLPA